MSKGRGDDGVIVLVIVVEESRTCSYGPHGLCITNDFVYKVKGPK